MNKTCGNCGWHDKNDVASDCPAWKERSRTCGECINYCHPLCEVLVPMWSYGNMHTWAERCALKCPCFKVKP